MVCSAHVDCPVKLRFVPNRTDGTVSVEVSHVAHSLMMNQIPRRGCPFTFDQLEEVRKGTNHGKRPKEMMRHATEELLQVQPDAEKRPEGGLVGVQRSPTSPCTPCTSAPCLMLASFECAGRRAYRADIRQYQRVSRIVLSVPCTMISQKYHVVSPRITGIATHAQYANKKKRFKEGKVAGVALDDFADLVAWAKQHELPEKQEEMVSYQLYVVPMDLGRHLNVEAVALTASIQVGWIEQLTKMPQRFVLHIDGKHKIHFGKWILITVGTHSIKYHNGVLSHSFRPLIYMFSKQHESTDSIRFLLQALNKYAYQAAYQIDIIAYQLQISHQRYVISC